MGLYQPQLVSPCRRMLESNWGLINSDPPPTHTPFTCCIFLHTKVLRPTQSTNIQRYDFIRRRSHMLARSQGESAGAYSPPHPPNGLKFRLHNSKRGEQNPPQEIWKCAENSQHNIGLREKISAAGYEKTIFNAPTPFQSPLAEKSRLESVVSTPRP
jgi:hypothetical protein